MSGDKNLAGNAAPLEVANPAIHQASLESYTLGVGSTANWNPAAMQASIATNMEGVVDRTTGQVNPDVNNVLTGSGPGSLYYLGPEQAGAAEKTSVAPVASNQASDASYNLSVGGTKTSGKFLTDAADYNGWMTNPELAMQEMAGFGGSFSASTKLQDSVTGAGATPDSGSSGGGSGSSSGSSDGSSG